MDGDLWVMNADGSGRRQVTHSGDGSDFDPSWSPDGSRIVFRTSRGSHLPDPAGIGLDGIYVANADDSGEQPVQPRTGGLFPDWSPSPARPWTAGLARAAIRSSGRPRSPPSLGCSCRCGTPWSSGSALDAPLA